MVVVLTPPLLLCTGAQEQSAEKIQALSVAVRQTS